MKRIAWTMLYAVIFIASAYAADAPNSVPAAKQPPNSGPVETIDTRYGQVQYERMSANIRVNGKAVWETDNELSDGLDVLGHFKLRNEDVILFENAPLTRRDGIPGEVFFLILKPNQPPLIVDTPLDTSLKDNIEKVWQEDQAIYIEFKGDEIFASPIKLVSDDVVMTPKQRLANRQGKPGSSLKSDSCSGLYNISKDDCSTKFTERHEDCAKSANAATGIGITHDAKKWFTLYRQLPGFNETKFNESCRSWCNGKDVWYDDFSKVVCNIK